MASNHSARAPGRMARRLRLGGFHSLVDELIQWNIDPEIVEMQKNKDPGLILPFVKGLRLSARLVYIIRDHLSCLPLQVSWGHLLSPNGDSCSPECDVIVHQQGQVVRETRRVGPAQNRPDKRHPQLKASVIKPGQTQPQHGAQQNDNRDKQQKSKCGENKPGAERTRQESADIRAHQ